MIESDSIDSEISARIDEALGTEGDVIPALAAAALVEELRASDPALLASWLDRHAEAILREHMTARIRSLRARARATAAAGVFASAARRFVADRDPSVLKPFEVRYVVDGADTQRRVADMTAADCRFVAERYEISGQRLLMLAAFHRAVAARIGELTVGAVFTEEQYDRMYRSITGQPAAVA